MSSISKTQLIKDCADAYRSVVNNSDPVRYDEIAEKIGSLASAGVAMLTGVEFEGTTTATVTDIDGAEHEIEATYDAAGNLTTLTYDGLSVNLTYTNGVLTKVGYTSVTGADSFPNSWLDYTVTFKANNQTFEKVTVVSGTKIPAPLYTPSSGTVTGWIDADGNAVNFTNGYLVTKNEVITAVIA